VRDGTTSGVTDKAIKYSNCLLFILDRPHSERTMSSDGHIFTAIPYEGFDALLGNGTSSSGSSRSWWSEKCGGMADWLGSLEFPSCRCNCRWTLRLPRCDCSLSEERTRQWNVALRWLLVMVVAVLAGLGLGVILSALWNAIQGAHHHHQHHHNNHASAMAVEWLHEEAMVVDAVSSTRPKRTGARHLHGNIHRAGPKATHKPHGGFWKAPRIRHHKRPDPISRDDFFPLEEEIYGEEGFFPLQILIEENDNQEKDNQNDEPVVPIEAK
jgi:hypothetical protein